MNLYSFVDSTKQDKKAKDDPTLTVIMLTTVLRIKGY